MFITTNLALVASFLTLAVANPLSARATCQPNFQGNAMSIATASPNPSAPNAEWTAQSFPGTPITLNQQPMTGLKTAEFLVEFTGQPTNNYHIK